ncbi:hypothetical protein ACOSP7_010904 [Xanthoceras sorbifolium]|uniref:Transcription repressor n=1 Tax=Xanthoceras sorbifolium TaxID=99658 RepID=A0ABQ8HSF5_9ROSI|nr:hypothetical protein JRO89_XS07G0044900 [Xanthoceras sorbifolium]
MAKRLKLKLSRVIPALQFCRSKRSSAFVETPLPAIYRLSPINPKVFDVIYPSLPAPPPSTPEHRFIKRNLSSKLVSVGCTSCRSAGSCTQNNIPSSDYGSVKTPEHSWKKEEARWYVVPRAREGKGGSKIYDASSDNDMQPACVKQNTKTRRNKTEKKRVVSVSSHESGCFSSEEEEGEETETPVSSSIRSFSDEYSSSELDHSTESTSDRFFNSTENKPKKKKVNTNIKKIRRLKRYASKNYKSPGKESEARTSVLSRMRIPSTVEGKVRESVAVVKKSVDPYGDFKQSMWEMILEKQMFEAKDLEQLLQCFLSLNSSQYHGTIVEAFSEIWEVLFCDFPVQGVRVRKEFKA